MYGKKCWVEDCFELCAEKNAHYGLCKCSKKVHECLDICGIGEICGSK